MLRDIQNVSVVVEYKKVYVIKLIPTQSNVNQEQNFQDCNTFQQYSQIDCKCLCKNKDEEKKCYKNHDIKLWDPEICSCRCRQETACSTGFNFDTNTCKCTPIPVRRRYIYSMYKLKNKEFNYAQVPTGQIEDQHEILE